MIATAFAELVGASVPIQLAPMPGVVTPALATAVADAGGVGMLPTPGLSPAELEALLDDTASRTAGVIGVGFLIPFLDVECVEVAGRRAQVVDFFYGEPDGALVERVHKHGVPAGWQVGSAEEAIAAETAGCDFVIAQGTEAGGHVRGATSVLPLLAQVLDRVSVPVLAAGGIATARDVAAVLAAGAAGVRVGTRFVASAESAAHPDYVTAILSATAADTMLTETFSVMWPNAPHRVLRSAVAEVERLSDEIVGEAVVGDRTFPVPRRSVMVPTIGTTGRIEAMALYAGESVANISTVKPAREIVEDLMALVCTGTDTLA